MLRFPGYGNRSQPCREQQGLDGAVRAVGIEANLVLPHSQEFVGSTAASRITLENALYYVQSRETEKPAKSGDDLSWQSGKSPILRVRSFHSNTSSGGHRRRG